MSSASGRGKPSRSASSVIVDKSVGYHDLKIDGYALTAGAPTASAKLRNFATGGSLGCALFAKTETLGRLAWARGGAGVESVRVHRCAAGGEPRRGPRRHVRGPAASANELCEHIDVGTVKSTLALAERHRCDGLKEECLDFLADPANLRAAICTHGLRRLSSRRFLLDF